MVREKTEHAEDGADEKMLGTDEKDQLAKKDEVKFIAASDRSNGDAKIDIGHIDKVCVNLFYVCLSELAMPAAGCKLTVLQYINYTVTRTCANWTVLLKVIIEMMFFICALKLKYITAICGFYDDVKFSFESDIQVNTSQFEEKILKFVSSRWKSDHFLNTH